MKTSRTRNLPLFYTHVIGSLPRPQLVRQLLARRGDMAPKEYRAALDDVVRFAIRLQETAGLDVISDGEWRRRHYVGEFLERIGGFEKVRPLHHAGETKLTDVVVHRITAERPVFRKDAEFLVRHAQRLTKFALPSPFLYQLSYPFGLSDWP